MKCPKDAREREQAEKHSEVSKEIDLKQLGVHCSVLYYFLQVISGF
jgi:hypothetical protein